MKLQYSLGTEPVKWTADPTWVVGPVQRGSKICADGAPCEEGETWAEDAPWDNDPVPESGWGELEDPPDPTRKNWCWFRSACCFWKRGGRLFWNWRENIGCWSCRSRSLSRSLSLRTSRSRSLSLRRSRSRSRSLRSTSRSERKKVDLSPS